MITVEMKDYCKIIKHQKVLNNINLILKDSTIYSFIGKNGSGKTMLFRAISGLIKPTRGSVTVFNKKIESSFPENMGLTLENIAMWSDLTGYENLELLAAIRKQIGRKEIEQALVRVGLEPGDVRQYKKYSLGMKQKLAIAQAIMEKPLLLMLDEPTNSLDDESTDRIHKILAEEKDRGATVLIASHVKEEIELLSDQIYKMQEGKMERIERII